MRFKWPEKKTGQPQAFEARYHRLNRSLRYRLYSICHKTGRYTLQVAGLVKSLLSLLGNVALSGFFSAVVRRLSSLGRIARSSFGRGDYSLVRMLAGAFRGTAGVFSGTRRKISEEGIAGGIFAFFRLSSAALLRFRRAHRRFFNWAPPVFGAAVLGATVLFWNGRNYALKVMYDGHVVGYVHTQQSYYEAADSVESAVRGNSGQLFTLSGKPEFHLVMSDPSRLTSESRLSGNLVACAGSQIVHASGLYVDNVFVGAYNDGAAVRQMLSGILASYKTHKKSVKKEEISFVQNVTVKNGLYPRKTIETLEAIKKDLTHGEKGNATYIAREGDSVALVSSKLNVPLATLYNLNPSVGAETLAAGQALTVKSSKPLVTIQVTRTEKYTQKVAYTTKKVETSSLYKHKTQVKKKGKSGKALVTAKVTYINGKVSKKTVVEKKVVKDPVAKVVLVGTKPTPSTAATGNFSWPVRLGVAYISSPFGGHRHHPGLDLACNQGTPIHAADGGSVEFAGWYSGYGNCVILRHSGSLETLYGHCSKLLVSAGARVYKGQVIALVGHTGFVIGRTGNHCHFEVRVNGVATNPIRFLH